MLASSTLCGLQPVFESPPRKPFGMMEFIPRCRIYTKVKAWAALFGHSPCAGTPKSWLTQEAPIPSYRWYRIPIGEGRYEVNCVFRHGSSRDHGVSGSS